MAARNHLREIKPLPFPAVAAATAPEPRPATRVQRDVMIVRTPTHEIIEEIRITETPEYRQCERTLRDSAAPRRLLIARVSALIWLAAGITTALLAFRLALGWIGADASAGLAELVYGATGPILAPFSGLGMAAPPGSAAVDLPALIAAFAYLAAAMAIVRLIGVLFAPSPHVVTRRHIYRQPHG
jgi:uncharacterized protein YggT (Ycf19 family)